MVASRRTARLDAAALAFNHAGRGVGRAAILGAVGVELARRRRWVDLAGFALAEAGTAAGSHLAFMGMAANCAIFAFQNASKSSGAAAAG